MAGPTWAETVLTVVAAKQIAMDAIRIEAREGRVMSA